MFLKRISNRLAVLTGAVLLTGLTAFAQMRPGDSPQQTPVNPSNNSTTDTMQAQQNAASAGMQDKAFVRNALEGGWPKFSSVSSRRKRDLATM